ncbi:hypothetical protein IW262DRAFT_1462638 [Armillaria fumosa]|nr:hypothetical protein IW262DRAFT_1462638 [Armillaria fumosa]
MGAQETASITALIQKSRTVIKYLKDVKEGPKECNELLRELRHIEIHLSTVKIITLLSTTGDPWLMILPQLNDPFKELTTLLHGIEKGLNVTSLWWKRMAPRLQWTFAGESAQEDLRKIEDIGSVIMDVVGQHESLAFSLNVQQKLCNLEDKLNNIQNRKRAEDIAAWFTPLDYTSIQQDKLEQRIGNTGRWFLESSKFRNWVAGLGKSSTLWCPGNPGTGKTILASIVVDHLRKQFAEENIPVLGVFGDWQNADAQTALSVIRSLLKQLLDTENGLSSSLQKRYKYQTLSEFTELLSTHIKRYPHAYIVFDALDEFTGDQKELISVLKSLGDNIRLLVTSRDDPAIQRMHQDDEELRIQADDADIKELVMSKLTHVTALCIFVTDRDDLRHDILTRVVEKAQGMFLLAEMYMKLLGQTRDRSALVEALNKLPDTINSIHNHFLERVERKPEQQRQLAYQIFGWVAFAERPLTILELQYALAMRAGTTKLNRNRIIDFDLISDACVGLVVVDSRGYVRFPHPTTREYFISQKDKHFPSIQEDITRTCLTYMSFKIFRSPDILSTHNIPARYPLLNYSSRNWTLHARKCVRGSLETEILTFLQIRARIALSFEQPPDSEPEIPRTPAWFTANYGLVHVMEALLDRGIDLQHENSLCIAAHAGQIETVKFLLLRDDVDVNQANKVTYLPDYSIDGTDSDEIGAGYPTFCTPLIAAASNGHERTVKTLLMSERMRSLNFSPSDGPTALSAAVLGNHVGVMKLLLSQPGIDTSIRFLDETPLMLARRTMRADLVKMLLERGDSIV